MRGSPDGGTLVRDRESFAHKLPRTSSSDTGCQMLCQRQNSLHLGGTVSPELNRLTRDLRLWYLDRNITLQATDLAGVLNVTAEDWSQFKGAYANPPWNMIGKVLSQVYRQHAQLVLIDPLLLEMIVERTAQSGPASVVRGVLIPFQEI